MTLVTVEGTFNNGKIELSAPPAGVQHARVLVTFLPDAEELSSRQYMAFGQLRREGARMSSEEDFKIAEWNPGDEALDAG